MKIKKIFNLLFFLACSIKFYCQDAGIHQAHKEILSEYFKIKSSAKLYDHMALQELFKKAADVDNYYLKRLKTDISHLKKLIKNKKKNQESVDKDSLFLDGLQELQNFLKKYQLQMEIIAFHSSVKKDWADLMHAVDKNEDILPKLSSKGISKPGVKGLKILINKMNKLLNLVEGYEYRLHADWIDLKLINYVLKIELIRLRNAAIFHPLYRGTPIVTNYPR